LENKTIIDFRGVIQYETIGELIHEFKNQIHTIGIQVGIYKRILLVMIESLENIMKHSAIPINLTEIDNVFVPVFSVIKNEHHYLVISSNLLSKQGIPSLKDKIDHLNSLDKQGVKDFYKETITNGIFTKTGGASLGLVEIAKISGKMINYEFSPVNETYARFTLKITIDEIQT
jgi:hypothetical protein